MTESSGGQDQISCSDAALFWDKEVSEALTVDEQQALSRHLSRCPQCRDFVKLTSSLPLLPDKLSGDELDFAIHRVMENARGQRRLGHRRTLRWTVPALAASIAAVMLVGILRLSLFSAKPSETPVAFQCSPAAPTEPVPGVFMTYCDGGRKPEAIIGNGGDMRVSLQSGTIGLLIDPDRPGKHKVIIETPQGKVQVKGTLFTVHVDRENEWVEVFRGVVEIVPTTGDADAFDVSAGHGAEPATGNTFVLTAPKTDVLRQKLLASAVREEPTEARDGGEMPKALSSKEATELPESDEPVDSAGVIEQGEQVASESHHGSNGTSKRSAESIYTLIQEAQSCLIDRDWTCAATRYREVLTRYSQRPESMAVLISLAKIELRYLGAPKDALAYYKSYQQRAPNGPLAEEALFGIAEVYRHIGVADEEEKTLRRFIEQYPESTLVQKARARLKQLEE